MKSRTYSPSYLVKNPYSYCFRIKIPKDLQTIVSKKELRYSLGIGMLSDAKVKARFMAGQFQLLFRKIRHMNLTKEQIHKLIKDYKDRLFEHYDKPAMYDRDNPISRETEFEWTGGYREWLLDCLASGNYSDKPWDGDTSIEQKVHDALSKQGVKEIKKTSSEYLELCQKIVQTEIKGIDHYQRKLRGEFPNDFKEEHEVRSSGTSTITQGFPTQSQSRTISQVIERYFEEGSLEGQWKDEDTRNRTKASMKMLIDYFRDVPINTLSPDMMREYKLLLFELPTNWGQDKRYKGVSLKEIRKMGPHKKTLGEGTVRKHLKRANTLFKYAKDTGEITVNPAKRLIVKKTKRPDEEKDLFTPKELKTIFESELFVKNEFRKSYQLWLPLLLLYTGARREEICSLYLEDFEKKDGVWCININDNRDKQLKNNASKRIIPLHPFLIEDMQIIKRVDQLKRLRKQRFFPDLKPYKGKYGYSPGRWFRNFKEPLGFPVGEGKDLHSFRHTLTDNLKQQLVNSDVIEELTGHVLKGEGMGRYGKKFRPDVLYNEAILKLDYGIELSHLKASKYAGK